MTLGILGILLRLALLTTNSEQKPSQADHSNTLQMNDKTVSRFFHSKKAYPTQAGNCPEVS